MDDETEMSQIITEEDNTETEEIHEIDAEGQLSVIPFQLIKIPKRTQPTAPQFETVVKGKYSKYYKQTYRPAWEQMPDFKGWLKGVKGEPTRAYCIYCQKTLHAHRLSLLKHTCTIRHQKAAQLHGNPTQQKVNFNINMENSNIQTVIVNEESILTEEDDSNELMQPQIVYTTQVLEEIEDAEQDQESENEHDNDDDSDEDFEESASSGLHENLAAKKRRILNTNKPIISTHVVDTTRGSPVSGLSVSLYKLVDGRWTYINEGLTDSGGRFNSFITRANFTPGRYKLHYDVDRYFELRKQESLYPFIEVVFDSSCLTRYHFPLLLSPNSYTTYRSTHDD